MSLRTVYKHYKFYAPQCAPSVDIIIIIIIHSGKNYVGEKCHFFCKFLLDRFETLADGGPLKRHYQ